MGEKNVQHDTIESSLRLYAQTILVVVFGLLPIIFVPSLTAPFDYTKVCVIIIGISLALVLYSLSVLRSGQITVGTSPTLIALWVTAGVMFLSAILSGDFKDSFVGDLFSIHSTVFVVILALIPTVIVLLKATKASVMRMYILLAGSTLVLVFYHILRLIFGADFLSFSIFTSNIATPVGSWNDLALFLGLTVILSLVTLAQLSLTKTGKTLFVTVCLLSLFMLGVINFFTVWLVLGLVSLATIVYSLGKDKFMGGQIRNTDLQVLDNASFGVALMVFVLSVFFVIGGSTVGGWISKNTGISYVEVRPSFQATADIARNVYHENAFLGIGTNKFTDAWRLYKDTSINSTPFWNTEFNAGNGYITTFFVTTGVLGGVAWLVFLITYFVTGVRRLLSATTHGDKIWYFIGLSSFVSALYIWGMSIIYVPGVVILLLGSLCVGVSLHAFNILSDDGGRVISVGSNRRTGFALTIAVILVIIGSVSILYVAGRHYSSVFTFNQSVLSMQQGKSIDELEREVISAYELSSSDVFARRIAEYQLARMNNLVAVTSPTDEQRMEFQNASVTGVNAAQQAIQIDGLEPTNWSILGGIYGALASVGVEGAKDRALEALTKSRELNPKNPLPFLESAIIEARSGNYEGARSYIQQAITLKPNFTEAYYLLSQIDMATGNVDAAIQSSRAVISLEPQNPVHYYQLGVLESSKGNLDAAIPAFEQSVALDTNYANARYLLALAYDEQGESNKAKEQLEMVLNLNPGNADITKLLEVLQRDGSLESLRGSTSRVVNEVTPVINDNGTVSSSQGSDTPLVNTVNTTPKDEEVNPL